MDYTEIVSISKLPGLFKINKKRADGLIVNSLIDDKLTFVSSRAHVFTPLENITIYTDDEPMELKTVFESITKYKVKNEIPDAKADNSILKKFFKEVVKNYDDEKVYVSDIKKIIKWYILLDENKMFEVKKVEKKEEVKVEKKPVKTTKATKTTKKSKTTKSTKKTKA